MERRYLGGKGAKTKEPRICMNNEEEPNPNLWRSKLMLPWLVRFLGAMSSAGMGSLCLVKLKAKV